MNFQPPMQNLQVPEAVRVASINAENTFNQAKTGLAESINGFSTQAQAGASASQSFLQSNTIVAKIAFLIFVLILFLIFMALGIQLLQYFLSPSNNPYIISGMLDGTNGQIVRTDPSVSGSIPIPRSNNQSTGLEFTWSIWLYINDLGMDSNKYQHIFNKGDTSYDPTIGISTVNNGPGLYLAPPNGNPSQATLHIIMNTSSNNDIMSSVDITNCPIRKWFHVALRMENTIMDVYVNGVVTQRLMLQNVPKQNYNDINICQNGGFNGKLSNLRYYSSALNAFDINNIVSAGPNPTQNGLSSTTPTGYYKYLSTTWYAPA
jgi:hypothetical protein